MQRTMKRIGALILALAMLVTFMPSLGLTEQVHADDEEGITVYLTVSNKGVIAEDKDGEAMAWREVTVKDLDSDGNYSFDEALVAAHDAYYEGGAAAGYVTGVSKLWGVETENVLFFINGDGISTGVTGDYVEENDYLTAAILTDEMGLDWVSNFDERTITASKGDMINLNLSGHLGMAYAEEDKTAEPLGNIEIGIWKDGLFESLDEETDENGNIALSFDEPGTYIITAKPSTVKKLITSRESGGFWFPFTPTAVDDLDENEIWGKADWSAYAFYGGYTETDYGDGPYPYDELNWVKVFDYNDFDFEPSEEDLSKGYFMHSGNVIYDSPLIAPCCVVNVADSCDVSVTINNQGVLASDEDGDAMADREVTVNDLDGDGKFTVDEALKAAHEQYFENGTDGYATAPGAYGPYVSKLWGEDTSNTIFFVNGNGLSMGVTVDEVTDGDYVYASINGEEHGADWISNFDDTSDYAKQNEDITVHLTGHLGMGYSEDELEDKDLEGIQIGYWEDGKFVAIPGAVTDKNGEATFFLDEVGDYLITAKGTVKSKVTDYSDYPDIKIIEADCPIMAPYCFLEVGKASSTSAFDKKKADAFSELFDTFDPAKYRSKDQMKVLSLLVKAQSQISAANTTADITKAVDAAKAELKKITTDAQYKKQEAAFKKLKIKGVKAKAGKKKVTVTWKKAKVSGYEIVCKAGKTKKAVIKKAATVKKVIKGLTSKKKCTTKIRGFKTIGGKKVYTAWAKAKTVKVK